MPISCTRPEVLEFECSSWMFELKCWSWNVRGAVLVSKRWSLSVLFWV